MKREDWLQVMKEAPDALERCKTHFQERYGDNWRACIRRHDVLINYFKRDGVTLKVEEDDGGHQYTIMTPVFTSVKVRFKSREEAQIEGIKDAFRYFELYGGAEKNRIMRS